MFGKKINGTSPLPRNVVSPKVHHDTSERIPTSRSADIGVHLGVNYFVKTRSNLTVTSSPTTICPNIAEGGSIP